MNVEQVKAEIIKMPEFNSFKWIGDSKSYAILPVDARHFRDERKRDIKLHDPYSIFIAHMYAGEVGKEFFYIIISRKGVARDFRKHSFYEIEFNKIYVSGKTVEEVVGNLQKKFDNGYDFV